jgi:hypothetical protein
MDPLYGGAGKTHRQVDQVVEPGAPRVIIGSSSSSAMLTSPSKVLRAAWHSL